MYSGIGLAIVLAIVPVDWYNHIMLKQIIIYIKQKNRIEYLEKIISESRKHGAFCIVEKQDSFLQNPINDEDSILVTDCEKAVAWAEENKVGYLVYETQENRNICFGNALCIIQGFDEIDYEFLNHMYEREKKIPWEILRTKRCIVREITVQDVKVLYEIYHDPSITLFMEGLYENIEDEIEFTKAYIENMYGFYGYGMWIIEEISTGTIIGRAGITNRDGYDEMEIGYLIDRSHQRMGYAEEVCRAIITYAYEKLGAERLNSFIQEGNTASIGLCKKIGFDWIEEVIIEQKRMQRYLLYYKNVTNS
jgi:RimJ/RimL family protein N-acetyltransferase